MAAALLGAVAVAVPDDGVAALVLSVVERIEPQAASAAATATASAVVLKVGCMRDLVISDRRMQQAAIPALVRAGAGAVEV
jgi:hypothetical protein